MKFLARRPYGLLTHPVSCAAFSMLFWLGTAVPAQAQTCPLQSAQPFAVLGGSAVTNINPTSLVGDLGVSPGTSITGLGSIVLTGTVHNADGVSVLAQSDIAIKYQQLAALPFTTDLTGLDLGGRILTPGVYHFDTSAQLTGLLTLDATSDPNGLFVFQIGTTLTTASNSTVSVIGGPDGNIFWQVGSSATLGTATHFAGNILALASITLNTAASMECGAVFAQSGAVSLDNNIVQSCWGGFACSAGATPTPVVPPTATPQSTPSAVSTPVPTIPGSATFTPTPHRNVLFEPTIPPGCVGIPASIAAQASTRLVMNRATVMNRRNARFAQKAAVCGVQRYKEALSGALLAEIETALHSGFTTTAVNCPGSICENRINPEDKRAVQKLIHRLYQLQVKTKLGAMAACPPARITPTTRNLKDSRYFYKQALLAINKLPGSAFSCE